MHYFIFVINFQKLPRVGDSPPLRFLIFDFGDLKLRGVAKFTIMSQVIFNLIHNKSEQNNKRIN